MSSIDILHPELLSNEMLLQIFQERRIKLDGLEKMEREKLLQLYHQFCLPLAQRKRVSHRSNSTNGSIEENNNPSALYQYSNEDRKTKLTTECNGGPIKRFKANQNEDNKRKSSSSDDKEDPTDKPEIKRARMKITFP